MTTSDSKGPVAHEINPSKSVLVRALLIVVGTIFLIIGVIGIFLPLLPTAPFVIVTAACYAKSSSKFYNWLLGLPIIGKLLKNWREQRRIPFRVKVAASTAIVITVGLTMYFFIPIWWVNLLLAAIAISVIIYICRIPS